MAYSYRIVSYRPKGSDYCLLIPLLNEGEKITSQLAKMQPYRDYADIVVADGGTNDGSLDAAISDAQISTVLQITCSNPPSGQYSAGIDYALKQGYLGVITMDGNDKDDPEAIPRFIEALKNGYDVVQGSRFMPGGVHRNTPLDRNLGIRFIFNPLMWLGTGYRYTDGMNGFKAYSRRYLEDARVAPTRDIFTRRSINYYLIYRAHRLDFRVTEIPVTRCYPAQGKQYSKIRGLGGRLDILNGLVKTLTGRFNAKGE